MPRALPHATDLRRPAGVASLLSVAALTMTACDGGHGPTVVTVTATSDGVRPQSAELDGGPAPTDANGGQSHPMAGSEPGSSPEEPSPEDTGGTRGQITLAGNVVDMTTSELMDISEINRGGPSPNGEPETNGYIVLELDQPQQITARKSGSPQPWYGTVSYISLATPRGSESGVDWSGYTGKHVVVTTTADGLWSPSDTGLPLGMVRLSGGTVQ